LTVLSPHVQNQTDPQNFSVEHIYKFTEAYPESSELKHAN